MSTLTEEPIVASDAAPEEDNFDYKALSRAAVISVIFALFGLLAWESPYLIVLPAAAVVLALMGLRTIRRFEDELTGRPIAMAGLSIGLLMLVVAPVKHTIIYLTEVPEGYQRVSFGVLKSPTGAPDIPTRDAVQLNGQKIFLKGYIHPTSLSSRNSKTFILVPDWATCCFGTQPPLTHMIEVQLVNDKYASKSFRQHSLAGTFTVIPGGKQVEGFTGVYYQLDAEHFQ
ncbi:DUF4190 domain-containing protein [Pirellulaceae bacterium SH449]